MIHRAVELYDALRGEPHRLPESDARRLAEIDLQRTMPGLAGFEAAEILADALATRAAQRNK